MPDSTSASAISMIRSKKVTQVAEVMKDLVAAQELLRHRRMGTTGIYKKKTKQGLADGMKALAAAVVEAKIPIVYTPAIAEFPT